MAARGAISPDELPAHIRALDGTRQDEPTQAEDTLNAVGFVDDALLAGITQAIRTQNGSAATHLPAEMAPAILALDWDTPLKPRTPLLEDGRSSSTTAPGSRRPPRAAGS